MSELTQSLIKDPRLGNIEWRGHEGQYGHFDSTFSKEQEWLAELIRKQADEKGYIYDEEGIYKYKLSTNGDFINRYKKAKGGKMSAERLAQLRSDREGLGGSSGGTANKEYWDQVKKDREARDRKYDEKHEETKTMFNNLIGVISDLNNTMLETNRLLEREKLK